MSRDNKYKEFDAMSFLEEEEDLYGYLDESSKSDYPEFKLIALEKAATAMGIQRFAKLIRSPYSKLYSMIQKGSENSEEETTKLLEKLARSIKRNVAKEKVASNAKQHLNTIDSDLLKLAKEAHVEAHPAPISTKPISAKEDEELSKAEREKKQASEDKDKPK